MDGLRGFFDAERLGPDDGDRAQQRDAGAVELKERQAAQDHAELHRHAVQGERADRPAEGAHDGDALAQQRRDDGDERQRDDEIERPGRRHQGADQHA